MLNPAELQTAARADKTFEALDTVMGDLEEQARDAQNGHVQGRTEKVKTIKLALLNLRRELEDLYS